MDNQMICGRFAPTPSGRMHLGNAFAALLAWLDVRSAGGRLVLRIEDLDTSRCSAEKAAQVLADMRWLGLDWDEGGLLNGELNSDYRQSRRTGHYQQAFAKLSAQGLVYPCFCSRAERMAANAPHREDGAVVYDGRCRNLSADERARLAAEGRKPAWRIQTPNEVISLTDGNLGDFAQNLAADCGDFILRRSDGIFAYQLAVVVDDMAMGVNRVVRGKDLLTSAPQQIWLHRLLGGDPPQYCHVPLLLAEDGKRLAKRDKALDLGEISSRHTAAEVVGLLAWWAGLLTEPVPITAAELAADFEWRRVAKQDIVVRFPSNWL